MARARITKQVIHFPTSETQEIADAKTNLLQLGWTLLKEWLVGSDTYLVFYKVLTN